MRNFTFEDPFWLTVVKVIIVFALLLLWTIFNVWFERRVIGFMQNRKGPNMNGPFGLFQAVGDGVKLLFKEDFRPARTDAFVFSLAPLLIVGAAFTTWTVIPFGGEVTIAGHQTRLQVTDLPVGVLFILAIAAMGFYGVVLAGWASNGTYSLLGSMRATAQVISYEVAMGASLVAVFIMAQSMSTTDIVEAQNMAWIELPGPLPALPSWYALLLLPSFIIFVISMFGETNRLPFDLAECESELVSGHLTDYSGFRYALFFLAEYINMATVSAIATTLFLGGYHAPWPLNEIEALNGGWWSLIWFFLKVQCLLFFFVWTRGALPRMRYDQFMNLGWKVLIPIALIWTMLLAIVRKAFQADWASSMAFWIITALVVVGMLIGLIFVNRRDKADEAQAALDEQNYHESLAGAYPVPLMPAAGRGEVISSTVEPETVGARAARAADENEGVNA